MSAVLVDASRGVGEVFACYVVDVFDAQNFFNGCIANVARASNVVFVIEFVLASFCNGNPHTDNVVGGIAFCVYARRDFDNAVVGFARHFDKLTVFRIVTVSQNSKRQGTRAGNDFLQSGDFSGIDFRNNNFHRVGAALTNGDFFNSARVKTTL